MKKKFNFLNDLFWVLDVVFLCVLVLQNTSRISGVRVAVTVAGSRTAVATVFLRVLEMLHNVCDLAAER